MVIFAYDYESILVCERVTLKNNVNGDWYSYFSGKKLRSQIGKLWPKLLETSVLILQDKARRLHLRDVTRGIEEYGWETLPHPAYSPDMSPPDYGAF